MVRATAISKIKDYVGKEVRLQGWIFNKRSSGGIIFLQLRDGTGIIQATVLKDKVEKEVFNNASELTLESSVILEGKIKKEKRSPTGYEMIVQRLETIQLATEDYPIGKKGHGVDFLLSNRHLWLRSQKQHAILKIRSKIFQAIEDFYQKEQFTRVDTPIITPSACEGTTTLFEIDYFGKKAYLSQSGQLYLETAIFSFGKVYDFEPVFRAEKSKTRRHLIEFWMTNAEVAFCNLEGIMKIQEKMIDCLLQEILKSCGHDLEFIGRDVSSLENIKPPFERITYNQAIKKLHQLGSGIKEGEDLGNDDETILMNYYTQPIFITHYPAKIKAFYMKRDPEDPEKALCCDLLAPEGYGEIIGGSEREEDYERLSKSMKEFNLPVSKYSWYLDLRKYGSVPHSGFGLGIERFIAWVCKLNHVREAIPFPRTLHRVAP